MPNINTMYEKDIEALIEKIVDLEVINERLANDYTLVKSENDTLNSQLAAIKQ